MWWGGNFLDLGEDGEDFGKESRRNLAQMGRADATQKVLRYDSWPGLVIQKRMELVPAVDFSVCHTIDQEG